MTRVVEPADADRKPGDEHGKRVDGAEDPARPEDRVGIVSFNLRGVHPHDLAAFLDQRGIAVRAGNHCAQPLMTALRTPGIVRASFALYNTLDEVDVLARALHEARELCP